MLPDNDDIRGLRCSAGVYRLDRWPKLISQQILFLEDLQEKWGKFASLSFFAPYDGYPGYLQVSLNGVKNETGFASTASSATVFKGFDNV